MYASEKTSLVPMVPTIVKTGLTSRFPNGWFAKLFDRSGNAIKRKLTVIAGVIDCDYRHEWGVVMVNLQPFVEIIDRGDRICQAVFLPVLDVSMKEVETPFAIEERTGGFGSTGK